jgi:hypothetical protein
MILNQVDIEMMMLEGQMKSGSIDKAFNHSDLDSRIKWISDIYKEFKEMNVHRIWKKVNKP